MLTFSLDTVQLGENRSGGAFLGSAFNLWFTFTGEGNTLPVVFIRVYNSDTQSFLDLRRLSENASF